MTYAQYGNIQSLDYNTLVGSSTSSTANAFNTTWATGSGSAGYGQSALAQVGTGDVVANVTWANLVSRADSIAAHQATTGYTSITGPTAPGTGNTIAYLSALPTNLELIYAQRLNAAVQGATVSNTFTTTSSWNDKALWTHTITFANGDAARYFFNSGGQLKMTCSHPSGTGIDLLLNGLASNVGTVVLSSISSGTVSIVGTTFNGVTKVGGGGNSPTISQNTGYYALTTSNTSVFTQTASTGPSSYLGTYINYTVRSNGPQGSNGDTGSIITIYTTWDEVPNGIAVSSGSSVTCTVQLPETGNIANTWGAISITGNVAVTNV